MSESKSSSDLILRAARRAARRRSDAMRKEAQDEVFSAVGFGSLHDSSHIERVQAICERGFREACTSAATLLARKQAEGAFDYTGNLREILIDQKKISQNTLVEFAAPKLHSMNTYFSDGLTDLKLALDRAIEEYLEEFSIGLVEGRNVRNPQSSAISVAVSGGISQVNVNSPGAAQAVAQKLGIASDDVKNLAEALAGLAASVAEVDLPQADRDMVEDAIVSAERELAVEQPDPSRLKRYLKNVVDIGSKVGVGAAGGFVGRIAAILAGLG